jgi:glycosyltransferase involved in cell wall biosynthesis
VDAYAGSEQVFEALAEIFPTADLYALSCKPAVQLDVGGRSIRTTFLDSRQLRDHRSATLPLMPLAWSRLGSGNYDLVITSHHAFAHANRLARPGGAHIAYVHSPARYIWTPDLDARGASKLLGAARRYLKSVDLRATRGVDEYLANSTAVAQRVAKFWHRRAQVITPPVRVEYFAATAESPRTLDYVLGFGRWIPYKNLCRVIEAADKAGVPVKIAGRGPEAPRIRQYARRATVPVDIVESPSDEELRELYRNALCLVFPTVEDFGIIPVEAQSAGCPVVAPAMGGALDTIRDGYSGILTRSIEASEIAEAIMESKALDRGVVAAHTSAFNRARFTASVVDVARRVSKTKGIRLDERIFGRL